MKPDIHPEYRQVVFQDSSADFSFITRSTIATDETVEWEDGNTYPLFKVDISSASHPFYTGTMKIVDTAGRVERFERRFGARRKAKAEAPEAEAGDTGSTDEPKAEKRKMGSSKISKLKGLKADDAPAADKANVEPAAEAAEDAAKPEAAAEASEAVETTETTE